tara:strand:+ start:594 stop:698 length:105 start_codon:yes stop_codon:yes gene_type:complete
MALAYDLFWVVIENETLKDQVKGFKVFGRYHASF